MYDKNEFKSMFGRMSNEQLIANALLPLTEEAMQATRELLAERGLDGHGLELAVAQTKRDLVQRTSATNECDYCGGPTAFWKIHANGQKFCSKRCAENSALTAKSVGLPDDVIYEHANKIRLGACPCCGLRSGVIEMRSRNGVRFTSCSR